VDERRRLTDPTSPSKQAGTSDIEEAYADGDTIALVALVYNIGAPSVHWAGAAIFQGDVSLHRQELVG